MPGAPATHILLSLLSAAAAVARGGDSDRAGTAGAATRTERCGARRTTLGTGAHDASAPPAGLPESDPGASGDARDCSPDQAATDDRDRHILDASAQELKPSSPNSRTVWTPRRAVVAVCAVLSCVAACSGSGRVPHASPSKASGRPTPSMTTAAMTDVHSDFSGFVTPSKNIGCVIDEADLPEARCDIANRSWTPPAKPRSCNLDYGYTVIVSARGRASFGCASDTALGGGPVLAYGHGFRSRHFVCVSQANGVTCSNRLTGHGFFLSRQRVWLF